VTDTSSIPQHASWLRADASRPYCTFPWRQLAVLSDGTAVCSCIDVLKKNPLGNFKTQSFDEVWNGEAYARLRRHVAEDIHAVAVCNECPHRISGPPPPGDYLAGIAMPQVLAIESSARCNLTCPGCDREAIEGSRENLVLDIETYRKVIDGLAPDLRLMEFHIGGENYLHPRAHEMVCYCRERNPNCFIVSSTNGHMFHSDERCRQVLDSGIDALILSIDGTRQETYERYRAGGNLQRVLDGMQRLRRLRDAAGAARPILIWRYLLFDWNDSPEEMQRARELAVEYGADHLAWHLNAVGSIQSSRRYYIGSPHLGEIAHELWDTLTARVGGGPDVDLATYRD
jgi:MoaA/NifB/PqqE/SkfB family radical SAM enzyme